jgi:RecA-family ATPase
LRPLTLANHPVADILYPFFKGASLETTEVISEILPRHEVSILAGSSGSGKSTLIFHIIKCFQQNVPVFGHAVDSSVKIGYLAADRTWDSYCVLAKRVGVDISQLYVRSLIDDATLSEEQLKGFENDPQTVMYGILRDMVSKGINLCIVDPVVVLLGSDINTYHKIAARMIRLNRFCKMTKLTLLGTHHATKARTDFQFMRPQDRISGSSALLGFTSTQLCLLPKEESGNKEFAEWYIVPHNAKAKCIMLDRDEHTGVFREAYTGKITAEPIIDAQPISIHTPQFGGVVPAGYFGPDSDIT